MKRIAAFVLLMLAGVGGVFAGDGLAVDLPEPVLYWPAVTPADAYEQTAPETFIPALPVWGHQELAYLWMSDPRGDGTARIEFSPLVTLAVAADSDAALPVIPANIRDNRFYLESVRLTRLAQETYDYGDYDASFEYAEEAIRYARLSDEYVAVQLRIKAANDAIAAARSRLDWAVSVSAPGRYPAEFGRAQASYDLAINERAAEHWEEAVEAANQVLLALANVQAAPPPAAPPVLADKPALPAQYTVRPWAVSRDCLWNIAGRPWVYNDSTKWRLIYDANRPRFPEPDNPDLIHPGMVLDIPSIGGESRQGMWDVSKTYDPLR
jgi:tetratricopeptide (TPR) repeat protein